MRERADGRCEYCRRPEATGFHAYHVEHILPRIHRGSSELDNLAWSCSECNIRKGTNLGDYDPETGILTPLFNPRMQAWNDHFKLNGFFLRGTTPTGRVTIQVLQLNAPNQIKQRQLLIEANLW